MGLDMYAFASHEAVPDVVDFPSVESIELHYWRKHPNLHGWMERLYYAKGGKAELFNCATVQLTADDLTQLEADIKANRLPHTEGFFFGTSEFADPEYDLAFVANARTAIEKGMTVYYSSWW